MPAVEMPIEQLKTYMGQSPCPSDIDEFWNNAVKGLEEIDPKVEFIPHKLNSLCADFFDLYFSSTKGARIHAIFARPKNISGRIPAVIRFHGLSVSAGDFTSLLPYVSQGFCIAAMDCRGQGGLSLDTGNYGNSFSTPFTRGLNGEPKDMHCVDLFLDTVMLARIIMGLEYVDESRIGVFGGSQGGALTAACAALVPEIKLIAPRFPYLSDFKRVWETDLGGFAYEGLQYYFRNSDPLHEHEDEIFMKLGYIDIQNLAHRIKAKVMMSTGLMDTICPPSTQFAFYNKITSEKSILIYPDYAHETAKGYEDLLFEFMCGL